MPEVVLIQLSSWGWAQSCSKHEKDSNKHIIEEIVRQVGHLPDLIDLDNLCNKNNCIFLQFTRAVLQCICVYITLHYITLHVLQRGGHRVHLILLTRTLVGYIA